MILPILEYGDIFLSAASKANRDKLQSLQDKALRIASRSDKNADMQLIHNQNNLLHLESRREHHLLQFMYNRKSDVIQKKVAPRKGIRTRASSKLNFMVRSPKTEKFKRCVAYLGPKKWNLLPGTLQKADNKFVFRAKHLKLIEERHARKVELGLV